MSDELTEMERERLFYDGSGAAMIRLTLNEFRALRAVAQAARDPIVLAALRALGRSPSYGRAYLAAAVQLRDALEALDREERP